ncbi:IS1595 family transposase [Alistipes ihumii]|uniref:IS1595 family transposase n=1 Tax=Alistipes ihumii TaxID=1470347 RepID=UPI002666577E|nr:IS1595 family transposase [Alistipes ihumii]
MLSKNFNSIIDIVKAFPTEQSCIEHLELLRWNGNVVSPFDATSKVYKCKGNKYRCKNTGKYFNVRTATLFDNTKVELRKWFVAIWIVTSHKKGISSLQLGRDIDVTQKTAWFMLQRIRKCFGCENNSELNNEVEIDETYIGGKNKNRHADKKVENSQGRSVKDKTPILGMVERKGKIVARKIETTSVTHITPEVVKTVKNAMVYTDEWVGYKQVNKIYDHLFVKHNEGEYVNGRIYTNTIEGFWSILKRGIVGIYHFTSRKHIQKYVDEFVFRYNTRNNNEHQRFNLFLQNTEHRLTYNELING